MSKGAIFRILSLDGGGVKGTFAISFLAELEKMTGKRLVDYFDLIVGTSTGGIIALALGLEIPAEKILELYSVDGSRIFPAIGLHRRVWYALRHAVRPKYDKHVLRDALSAILKDRRLGESKCRLVIPSYDAIGGDIHLFKTAHHERFKQDYKREAVDVAMATAAAPTYFPAFVDTDGLTMIDGGVWANCPVTVGLIEAINVLGWKPEEMDVLSIGVRDAPLKASLTRMRFSGWLLWNKSLLDLFMQAQTAASLAQAKVLTQKPLLRVELMNDGIYKMDDSRRIRDLKAAGILKARHHEREISERFLGVPVESFVPCYSL